MMIQRRDDTRKMTLKSEARRTIVQENDERIATMHEEYRNTKNKDDIEQKTGAIS